MEEFKADLEKFGSIAETNLVEDSNFENNVIEAIKRKDLNGTLGLLQAKAREIGNKYSWEVEDKKEFAYVLFVLIINKTEMPKEQALKMAATVYNKITGFTLAEKTVRTKPSETQVQNQINSPTQRGPKKPSIFSSTPKQESIPTPSQQSSSQINSQSAQNSSQPPPVKPKIGGSIFGSALARDEDVDPKKMAEKIGNDINALLLIFAKTILLKEPDLSAKLNHTISIKDRVGTNSILKEYATKYGNELGINIPEKKVLAYVLFREVFKEVKDIPSDTKLKMEETIYKNLTELEDFGKVTTDLVNAERALEATKLNEPRILNRISFSKEFYEAFLGREQEDEPITPIQSEKKEYLSTIVPGSLPFLIIGAKTALLENKKLKQEIFTAIDSLDAKKVMEACIGEAHATSKDFGLSEKDEQLLSFLLFYYTFQEYSNPNINAQRKQVMTASIYKNIVSDDFDSFYSLLTKEESLMISYRVFEPTLMEEILSGKYLTEESKSKVQRAIQRKAIETIKKEEKAAEKIVAAEGVAEKIEQWLRLDSKLIKKTNQINKLDSNTQLLIFNPNTEGYITEAKITGVPYRTRNMLLVKLVIEAQIPFPNAYDLAIGINKSGRILACSLLGNINDKNQVLSEINNVNERNSMEWDTLMFRLNSEKDIMKKIKSLGLKPPTDDIKEVIEIPVKMRRGNPVIMTLETFMLKEIKPSTIFFDIYDQMGEILEDIADEEGDMGGLSISSKLSKLGEKQERDWSGYEFKYLAPDDAVDLKLCPNCRKPFPDHRAEYRRCPNCLAKIDPTFWMQ